MMGDVNGMNDRMTRDGKAIFYVLGILMLLAFAGILIDPVQDKRQFAAFLFVRQDALFILILMLLVRFGLGTAPAMPRWADKLGRFWWSIPVFLLLICWIGHRLAFDGYALTRDEQMALFDGFIYRYARLGWPLPVFWQDNALALNQQFILPIAGHRAWLSDYLPVHALARTLVGMVVDPGLTNPLLTAIGAIALWRIARRLWPHDGGAQVATLLLYAGSSQIVVMGMSSYAMPGYLALNLVWLALFLRGGASGHGFAVCVGLIATGWHQPIFHPLFVLPFFAMLAWQRRWRLLCLYGLIYAGIGLAWLAWPHFAANAAGGAAMQGGQIGYGARITMLLSGFDGISLWLMSLNLLRFVAWQHLLLVPLVVTGVRFAWRDPLALSLLAGLILPVAAATLLLAYQGHGWGYRYLHGIIGNACLLGGYGWSALRRRVGTPALWTAANIATFLGVVPVHIALAASIVRPYATVSRAIDRTNSDMVVIDDLAAAFGGDLVSNRPDLGNRPVRLMASQLDDHAMMALCRMHSVAFIGEEQLAPIQRVIPAEETSTDRFRRLEKLCASVRRAARQPLA
ncbi:hypothetical protein [Sphingobium sp. Z007]|uniref:hypothetical protein n=2 Tax=Sphingobium sp. Z007 TaxID=627495 RepID=UPI000B499423|nr:hypothetical protein [Sphingobium sp. Z007]